MVPAPTCAGGIRALCKECKNAAERKRFVANDEHRERVKAWRAANPERANELSRASHHRHKEKRNADSLAYRRANAETMRANSRAWAKNNAARANEITAARRSAKLRATPAWAGDELEKLVIGEAYRLAKLRTEMTWVVWHVDHMVPLRSDLVCGLHCAANLQVIPASVNHSKNNLQWPDMF